MKDWMCRVAGNIVHVHEHVYVHDHGINSPFQGLCSSHPPCGWYVTRGSQQSPFHKAIAPIAAVTVSAGVARYRAGESVDDFIARADAALYKSKDAGRNRVTIEDPVA